MTYFLIVDTRALAFAAATSSILHVAGNTTMNFELQNRRSPEFWQTLRSTDDWRLGAMSR
jgi:hypothetical protein